MLMEQRDFVPINSRYDYDLRISTNNTERMRIKNDGNVGIGTTSPQSQLNLHKQYADSGIRNTSGISFTTNSSTTN